MERLEPTPRAAAPAALRPRLWLAAALLLGTVAAGAAARRAEQPATVVPPLASRFVAPGGGPVRFAGALEGTAVMPGSDGLVRLELSLGADRQPAADAPRRPTDLVVVLDRSGSMAGDKIVHARAAVRALIDALGEHDRFALVTYSDGAAAPIPLAPAGADRARWLAVVEGIQPVGGTDMASGLDLALHLVDAARGGRRVPRVLLISDGLANQGDSSREGLLARATRAARGEYALSTIGVGADFDEGLMAALADAGTGNFHFLASAAGLGAILSDELATARETVASALRVVIEPGPGVVVTDAAGYPLEHAGGTVSFRPGTLFAGQERRIWVTLRVPGDARGVLALGDFALEYAAAGERHRLAFAEPPRVAAVVEQERYFAALDRERWAESVIVDQTNALRRAVASALQEGRDEDALAEVQRVQAELAAKNEHVRSEAVKRQLDELQVLQERVEDAASGVAPMSPLETKELRALGYSAGRPGSRK